MRNDNNNGVPFEAPTPDEKNLWQALGQLEQATPSAQLHRDFYRRLDAVSKPTLMQRLRGWLINPWAPALACLLIGLALGLTLQVSGPGETARGPELAALQKQVSDLNRHLVLGMLAEESPGERLRGVMTAAQLVGTDPELANALLTRAASDRNTSVRSAAIDALGPQIRDPAVGEALMALLPEVESPLVQMALVDLILRHGDHTQLARLLELVSSGALHPDLNDHVRQSTGRVSA